MSKATTGLIAAGIAIAGAVAASLPAAAQDRQVPQITVTPFADGPGGTGYYGPYGRDLPGVYMLNNTFLPDTTPTISRGQVKLPGGLQVANQFSYSNPLPILDAWHGTLSGGWAF